MELSAPRSRQNSTSWSAKHRPPTPTTVDREISTSAAPQGRQSSATALRAKWLAVRVHVDAFCFDPLGYLQAVAWRIRGLRLRARHRFAMLMGRSPRAYALWIARVEPGIAYDLVGYSAPAAPVAIVPVVYCAAGLGVPTATLRSIAAQAGTLPPTVVGCPDSSFVSLGHPSDLASLVDRSGTWVCFVVAGDELSPHALEVYQKAASVTDDCWVIYADDDLIVDGTRSAPHFKPSWNSDLFEHHDFISGSSIIRTTPEMLESVDGPDWLARLTKSALERGRNPVHLPVVLHHRAQRPQPIPPPRPERALPLAPPSVSIIIPTRDGLSYLRTCIEGVRRTNYPSIEIIVVDNESENLETIDYLRGLERSGVNVLHVAGSFNFSALNNFAVGHARGQFLCFLNNDVELMDAHWLGLLVRQAMRSDLGAVGCRLLYPDGAIQHAGVVTGVGGAAGHAHRFVRDTEPGYFLRDRLPQKVSAVTAACLVVEKRKFVEVGGFDEAEFPVAFNDVDLCLKLNANGWQSFYEPRATLIHHESKTRGSDRAKANRARFAAELAALKRRWETDRKHDPFHHPQLSPFCEQFLIAV